MSQVTTTQPALPSIIERAAADPTFDLDKLQRLLDMQEATEIRNADKAFSSSHTAAEAEMETIRKDANNPQTRSRYATFAQVDRDARPIYTKHGFAISFTTEPMSTPDSLLVVGTLSHRLGGSRRYQVPVPIVTKGFKGTEMMTPIHATMSAVSYGKRNLEIMMFNLAIGDDDDGNLPRRPPPPRSAPVDRPSQEAVDPETGEVTEHYPHHTPGMVTWTDQDDWRSWGTRLMDLMRGSHSLDEAQQWADLNAPKLLELKKAKPALHQTLQSSIEHLKEGLAT